MGRILRHQALLGDSVLMGATWFKLHVKEFLSDSKILQLSHEQVGILVRLWAINCNDGAIPSDPAALSRLVPGTTPKQMLKHMLSLAAFFSASECHPGMLESIRLKAELNAYETKVERLRETGRRGGLAPKANAKANASDSGKQMLKQMGPEEEGEEEREKEVLPPTPSAARKGRSPRKPRGVAEKPKDEPIIPQPVVDTVNEIYFLTPSQDSDGRIIRVDVATLAERIRGLMAGNTAITPDLLVESWRDYLGSKPLKIKAPQYFFGKREDNGEGANWHPYAALIWHNRAKANQTEVPA